MLKRLIIATAMLGLSCAAQAQTAAPAAPDQLSSADLSAILDARVSATKFALQLTPEQSKMWPAIEEAIRARAAIRHQRIARLQSGQFGDAPLLDMMRTRGDNLIQRGESLKKLAAAWTPLAASLSEEQKHRLAVLTLFVLREARELLPRNHDTVEIWDESDE
jgi:hypothetical protein